MTPLTRMARSWAGKTDHERETAVFVLGFFGLIMTYAVLALVLTWVS